MEIDPLASAGIREEAIRPMKEICVAVRPYVY
jgi:hypothetical protein